MSKSAITLTKTGAFGPTGVLVNAAGTSVQLRQTIQGAGLTVTTGNSNNDTLDGISPASRHLEGYTQTRTVLFPVAAGTTAEAVEAKLKALPDACLYYMTSDDVTDILGANQLANMGKPGNKTQAEYEAQHAVTNPQTGAVTPNLYRATYFSATAKADVDLRVGARAKVDVPAAAPANLSTAVVTAPVGEEAPF